MHVVTDKKIYPLSNRFSGTEIAVSSNKINPHPNAPTKITLLCNAPFILELIKKS
jgi:hypothetical protein